MRSASYQQSSYGSQTTRSRIAAGLLALAAGIALFLLLLTMGVLPDRLTESNVLATFDVRPKADTDTRSAPKAAPPATPTPRREVTPPIIVPPLPPTIFPPEMIILSRRDFAAADIATIAPAPNSGGGSDGTAETADNGAGDAVGTGPDGQPMYNAQWYREPTRAEMATYMPKRRLGGDAWGLIVCRTIERYRVDDCHQLGESPGSGLSGAMRQAAWQFLIRPPRKGGKPMIGAWVRIRFDITESEE
jgi:protein TonB